MIEQTILRAICIEMLRQGAFDWRPAMQALYNEGEVEAAQTMAMWLIEASFDGAGPKDKFSVIKGGKSD